MAVFVLDQDATTRIENVKLYAEENPYCYEEMLLMHNGKKRPSRSEVSKFEMLIAKDWRFVYLIEEQKVSNEIVKMRHLSGFNTVTLKPPHPLILKEMMGKLGFKNPIEKCKIYFTEDDMIVNIMEEFE